MCHISHCPLLSMLQQYCTPFRVFFVIVFLIYWSWLITLYNFQVYNIVIQHLCTLLHVPHLESSSFCYHLFDPLYLLHTPPPFPLWEPPFYCLYEFIFVLLVYFLFYIPHQWNHTILVLFPSDLFHLAEYSQGPVSWVYPAHAYFRAYVLYPLECQPSIPSFT